MEFVRNSVFSIDPALYSGHITVDHIRRPGPEDWGYFFGVLRFLDMGMFIAIYFLFSITSGVCIICVSNFKLPSFIIRIARLPGNLLIHLLPCCIYSFKLKHCIQLEWPFLPVCLQSLRFDYKLFETFITKSEYFKLIKLIKKEF